MGKLWDACLEKRCDICGLTAKERFNSTLYRCLQCKRWACIRCCSCDTCGIRLEHLVKVRQSSRHNYGGGSHVICVNCMECKKLQITIDGKQIAKGRMDIVGWAINTLLQESQDVDLNLCDVLITIIPKSQATEG